MAGAGHLSLSCLVECWPPCSVGWYRQGEFIRSSGPRYAVTATTRPRNSSMDRAEAVLSRHARYIETFEENTILELKSCSVPTNEVK